ncbi:DUF1934 domain-containing protein [Calderihabitans maritimus]|uniref:Uncharacterized protein conserved in bacteria n=1 Tax=Calderihabitans maritimus TaxID=1246530 RepID=A0A1Z5HW59_9FIRM|nr:DUF1934 domain-containing protein [Calderihabitans maritimus]GAW93772.1 uncharacterized protein conserved in bacteria [Calderihabitans maritimus]
MKKDVWVRVKGVQRNERGEEDIIELITEGRLFRKEDSYYIIYRETAISGMEGTTTSLKVEPSRVTLNRMGASEQKQTFEEGLLHTGSYITAFGTFHMSVITSRVDVDLTDDGGSINLEYELQVGREKISDNKLSIMVENR